MRTPSNNWTQIEDMETNTSLDNSSYYLRNDSNGLFDDDEKSSQSWLLYTLFGVNCLLLIFGMFGNSLGMAVMVRSSNKSQTHSLLIIALAISDIVVLTTNFLNLLPLPVILNIDVRAFTDIWCTLYMVVDRTAKTNSAYLTVLICIDRYIAVQYPLRYKRILSRKVRIVSVCVCGCIALFVSLVPSILYSEIKNGICQFGSSGSKTFSRNAHFIYSLGMLSIFTFIPMMVLLSLTPIIIFKLCQRQAIRARLTTKEDSTRLFRTSVMLICVVIAYIILVGIPTAVFTALRLGGAGGNASTDILVLYIATAMQINHSINIVFYVISNIEFRQQFLRLFCRSCNCERQGKETNHSS